MLTHGPYVWHPCLYTVSYIIYLLYCLAQNWPLVLIGQYQNEPNFGFPFFHGSVFFSNTFWFFLSLFPHSFSPEPLAVDLNIFKIFITKERPDEKSQELHTLKKKKKKKLELNPAVEMFKPHWCSLRTPLETKCLFTLVTFVSIKSLCPSHGHWVFCPQIQVRISLLQTRPF